MEYAGTFSDNMQDTLMQLEDDSWWFAYRASIITGRMKSFIDQSKLVIDVGGGNGFTSAMASRRGYRMGIVEPSYLGCLHAMKRGMREVLCGAISDETIIDKSIDNILLCDVLEHI